MKAINTALVGIRRSPYQSILAIIILTITFFIAYAFSFLSIGSNQVLSFFETQPKVIAFFNHDATDDNVKNVENMIREKSYVSDIKIVGKKEALEIYQESIKDDPLMLELITEDILPISIEVSSADVKNLKQIKTDLENESSIEEAELQETVIDKVISWTNSMRLVGLFALIILTTTSFLMIMVTISMKISNKRKSIKIMKFIGADKKFIAKPFVLEAVINSIFANIIAFALYFILILYTSPMMSDLLTGIIEFPIPWQLYLYQFLAATVLATILGTLASFTAVKRMLKR
jgi:cell division transport system permease protein